MLKIADFILGNKQKIQTWIFAGLCVVLLFVVCLRVATKDMVVESTRVTIASVSPLESSEPTDYMESYDVRLEAMYMAKVLYGTAKNNTAEQQAAVCWCIVNRVESSLYPDSVVGVCQQSSQWMGYSDENPVVQDMYDVAYSVLEIWHSGGIRPMTNDYLYLNWDRGSIELRTTFEISANTRYWIVK